MTVLIHRLRAARVVPVVRTKSTAHARTVIAWLREAGLVVFELTMTIPDAPSLIAELAADPALAARTLRNVVDVALEQRKRG